MCDILRVECIPRVQFCTPVVLLPPFAMCAVYPVCLPSCVLAGALPGLGLTSPSYLKILFNRIIKPLTPGRIGVYKLLVYF